MAASSSLCNFLSFLTLSKPPSQAKPPPPHLHLSHTHKPKDAFVPLVAHPAPSFSSSSSELESVINPSLAYANTLFFKSAYTQDEKKRRTRDAAKRNKRRRTFSRPLPMQNRQGQEVLRKADFRNVRFLANFITEAGKILRRSQTKISVRAQRKVVREIKTARVLGLMPFTTTGTKSSEDYGES